jgi:hypothetical protein
MKIILFCFQFLFPVFVFAQDATWLDAFAEGLLGFFQGLVGLFLAFGVFVFVWGMVVFIINSGNEQARAEGKKKMVWGIVGLFVAVSVWGLVSLMQTLAGTSDGSNPGAPTVTNSL